MPYLKKVQDCVWICVRKLPRSVGDSNLPHVSLARPDTAYTGQVFTQYILYQ